MLASESTFVSRIIKDPLNSHIYIYIYVIVIRQRSSFLREKQHEEKQSLEGLKITIITKDCEMEGNLKSSEI